MSKKEVGIIIIVGMLALGITIGVMYSFRSNVRGDDDNKLKNQGNNTELHVNGYVIKYGKYKGVIEEYDYDTDTIKKEDSYIEITKTMIKNGSTSDTYKVIGNKITTSTGLEYEVMANNKLQLLAGEGVDYEYQK